MHKAVNKVGDWRPVASMAALKIRAAHLAAIRQFFSDRDVLEIDVPLLSPFTVTDPHIDALSIVQNKDTYYLQTSPEYYMKRLLAAGSGPIYYLGKAFRCDEFGPWHRPEFTMLEWYRPEFEEEALIDELIALCLCLHQGLTVEKISYLSIFKRILGVNPHTSSEQELREIASEHLDVHWQDADKNTWLELLFTHLIEPALPDGLVIVQDYPASLCALAETRCTHQGYAIAHRFECYWNRVEIANGYRELTDAAEQVKRFESDNHKRKALSKPERTIDPLLMGALDHGLPKCSGVALGIDRVLALAMGENDISIQLSF